MHVGIMTEKTAKPYLKKLMFGLIHLRNLHEQYNQSKKNQTNQSIRWAWRCTCILTFNIVCKIFGFLSICWFTISNSIKH